MKKIETNILLNFPTYTKADTILTNPGQFIFQLLEDDEIKIGKNHQISKKRIEEIIDAIRLIFKTISDNLTKYSAGGDRSYYDTIIKKLKYFVNNKTLKFPGLQVINLTKDHIEIFSKLCERLLICEKSDGVRYLLIHFANGNILFIGRNLEFYMIQTMSQLPTSGKRKDWEIESFLDGELIVDKVNLSHEEVIKNHTAKDNLSNCILINDIFYELKFLIFDAVMINGENIGHFKFIDRLKKLSEFFFLKDTKKKFMMKYSNLIENSILEVLTKSKIKKENFSNNSTLNNLPRSYMSKFCIDIFMKDYYTFDKIEYLYNLSKKLNHENDGIIINLDDYPYYTGQSFEIYKWKPANLNTIDFEVTSLDVNSGKSGEKLLVLNVSETRDKILPVSCLFFESEDEKLNFLSQLEELNISGKPLIAECYYNNNFNSQEVINYHMQLEAGVIKKTETTGKNQGLSYLNNYNHQYYQTHQTSNIKIYQQGCWQFLRFRKDKLLPNSLYTYISIWKTILENVQMSDIMVKIKEKNTKADHILLEPNQVLSTFVKNAIYKNDSIDFSDDSVEAAIKPVSRKTLLNTSNSSENPSSGEFLKKKREKDESMISNFKGIKIDESFNSSLSPVNMRNKVPTLNSVPLSNVNRKQNKVKRDIEKKEKSIRQHTQTLDIMFNSNSNNVDVNKGKIKKEEVVVNVKTNLNKSKEVNFSVSDEIESSDSSLSD